MSNALEFVRAKAREEKDDKLLLHRPRQAPVLPDAAPVPHPARPAGAADA
jgi:hypothetical protein